MEINRIVLSGRLVKETELKSISDIDLCEFRIASNRIVGKNKTEKAIFIDVKCWASQASICNKFLKKGSRVIVEGLLCQDNWKNKSGESVSKIYIESSNVIFLDQKDSMSTNESIKQPEDQNPQPKTQKNEEEFDGDLPF